MALPPTTRIRQDDTHRLIPAQYSEEGVLTALVDDISDLDDLYELESATNARLIAEAGKWAGISVHELVFGIPNANIVNASFCYPHPQGSRFNGPQRGAWYAGFTQETSIREITHHVGQWLAEVHWEAEDWESPRAFPYVDFLADFHGDFHDIRHTRKFDHCLLKDDYAPAQELAAVLLAQGSSGIIYPSVRHQVGTCLACFRPAMVTNVRRGGRVELTYTEPVGNPKIRKFRS